MCRHASAVRTSKPQTGSAETILFRSTSNIEVLKLFQECHNGYKFGIKMGKIATMVTVLIYNANISLISFELDTRMIYRGGSRHGHKGHMPPF